LSYGVFCDRGSASGAVAPPAGVTTLSKVTIGPGYDDGIIATASTYPAATGCNLRMTGSTVTGGWVGIYATGCVLGATANRVPVVLDIGGPNLADGNTFSWMHFPSGGNAVLVHPCVTRGTFDNNLITDNYAGITIDQRYDDETVEHPFYLRSNTFQRNNYTGMFIIGGAPARLEEMFDKHVREQLARAAERRRASSHRRLPGARRRGQSPPQRLRRQRRRAHPRRIGPRQLRHRRFRDGRRRGQQRLSLQLRPALSRG